MRRSRSIVQYFLFISLIIYFSLLVFRLFNGNGREKPTTTILTNPSDSTRLVLLWTDLFDQIYWHQEAFFRSSVAITCYEHYQCQFTRDRQHLSRSSVVAFHLYDISRNELPERELSNQTWIFITGESPINFYYQNPSFYPKLLDNLFDLSISYKIDSPLPIFSSLIAEKTSVDEEQKRLNIESLKQKKKPIVWFVSNCATFSQREKFVDELKKYIQIDIYGQCGKQCPNENHGRCSIDLHQYYFYLSFENSRCQSYITEKFWNVINNREARLVPIVLGAKSNDYERVAPNRSFIHVDQFKTAKDLAKYLRHLIENPQEYLLYLKWRETNEILPYTKGGWTNFLCPLCQIAHQRKSQHSISSSRLNFSSWFHPAQQCHRDDVDLFRTCKQTKLNTWMSLIHRVRCP